MPGIQNNKNLKKEFGHLSNTPDYIISEKSEASSPTSLPETEKNQGSIEKGISEQVGAENKKQGEGFTSSSKSVVNPATSTAGTDAVLKEKSPELIQIESILEENMAEAFSSMDLATKTRFKQEGEITASKIEQAIHQAKIKIKEILDLIRNWLKIIPGVNKYFIEQEAKIKGDKITALKKNSNY